MSVEEIERYNVLADEIRKLGLDLQKAEKSAEIASNRYYEAFQTEVRIEKALEGLASRQSGIEDSLKHLHGKFALLNSRVGEQTNAIEREIHLINGVLGMNYYPHMCRDGHQQIGHSDSEHEMCPLCREIAENRAQPKRKRERKGKK